MATKIRLRQICHSRSGDKGGDVNIGLAVYDRKHYEWVKTHVTAETVADYLQKFTDGPVTRYELPRVGALNFVVGNGLTGGASRTLILDGHGKSFSSVLLGMEIDAPPT